MGPQEMKELPKEAQEALEEGEISEEDEIEEDDEEVEEDEEPEPPGDPEPEPINVQDEDDEEEEDEPVDDDQDDDDADAEDDETSEGGREVDDDSDDEEEVQQVYQDSDDEDEENDVAADVDVDNEDDDDNEGNVSELNETDEEVEATCKSSALGKARNIPELIRTPAPRAVGNQFKGDIESLLRAAAQAEEVEASSVNAEGNAVVADNDNDSSTLQFDPEDEIEYVILNSDDGEEEEEETAFSPTEDKSKVDPSINMVAAVGVGEKNAEAANGDFETPPQKRMKNC